MKQSTIQKRCRTLLTLLCTVVLCTTLTACLPEDDGKQTTQQSSTETTTLEPNVTTDSAVTTNCSHTWGDWTVSTKETCTENGEKISRCSSCGEERTETIQAPGHKMANGTCETCGYTVGCQHEQTTWEITKDATCTEKGNKNKVCNACSVILATESINELGHDITKQNAKAATCTEKGHEAYEKCSRCSYTTYKETAAIGHSLTKHNAKAATCTEKGYQAYETCSRCNYSTYKEIAALGHNTTKHKAKAATCTEKGYQAYETCSRCDYTTYKETAALGHDIKQYNAKAATCTEKGHEAYEKCSRCSYSTYKETAALGHALTKHNAKAATCTAKGYEAYETCSRCSYSTYKETAALGHKYAEGVCSICGANDPNYVPALEEIKVPAIESSSTSIDPITQSSTTIEGAEFITYQGNITKEGQVDTYTYTVPRDGRLRIDFSEVYAGKSFKLLVLDKLGKNIIGYDYCYLGNNEGITFKNLVEGEVYQIKVYQHSGFSSYTMTLAQQKETTDISDYTDINDSIEFTDQRNVYTFAPTITGTYRFYITNMKSGKNIQLMVFNDLGENIIGYDYCYLGNDEGITLYLKAGEIYDVQVRHNSGYGNYTLSIGKQKPLVDITGFTKTNDSIEFYDQRNAYTFIPSISGTYRFSISNIKSGKNIQLKVFNELDENIIGYDYCYLGNSEGITLYLTAGETYTVQVRYHSGYSNYTLSIGKQKPSVDVTSLVKIFDSIQYTDQKNIYNFTADVAGNHTLTINDMDSSDVVQLYVLNELGETVKSDTSCKNGDYLVLKDLAVGTKYTILVYQNSGTGNYTLTIE